MPAGRYFIGDPEYFLHGSIAENTFEPGHYALPDGRGFILHDVSPDCFMVSEKATYTVSSGRFGIISVDLGDKDKYTGDGSFHEFSSPVTLTYDRTTFTVESSGLKKEFEKIDATYSDDEGYDSCG